MNAFFQTAAGNSENQDRGAVIHCGKKLVFELVRYPSGALPDDVTVIFAEL